MSYVPLAEELEAAEADAAAAMDALRDELYLPAPSQARCAERLAAASRAVRLFELELGDAPALPPAQADAKKRELERHQRVVALHLVHVSSKTTGPLGPR